MSASSMKTIKNRIKSISSTMQITKAMELVAASKMRKASEGIERSKPYFNILHETLEDIAKDNKDFSYLRYYFNDSYEVDDARGESNWTPAFFDEFQKYRGYDLRQHLPALLGMDTPDKNARVLYDYR